MSELHTEHWTRIEHSIINNPKYSRFMWLGFSTIFWFKYCWKDIPNYTDSTITWWENAEWLNPWEDRILVYKPVHYINCYCHICTWLFYSVSLLFPLVIVCLKKHWPFSEITMSTILQLKLLIIFEDKELTRHCTKIFLSCNQVNILLTNGKSRYKEPVLQQPASNIKPYLLHLQIDIHN